MARPSIWNDQQAVDTLGLQKYVIWREARKGTRFEKSMQVQTCERLAAEGDEECQLIVQRMTVAQVKARLKK